MKGGIFGQQRRYVVSLIALLGDVKINQSTLLTVLIVLAIIALIMFILARFRQ